MAAWNGWQRQLLQVLDEPVTEKNITFLSEWEAAERTTCAFNPLSVTVPASRSLRCKELAHGEYAQAYRTRQDGLSATVKQLRDKRFRPILDCLHSGDPFTFADWQLVVGALGTWGAHSFAAHYTTAMQATTAQGGAQAVLASDAGRSLHAYHHFSTVLAHGLPLSLHRADRQTKHALSLLRH